VRCPVGGTWRIRQALVYSCGEFSQLKTPVCFVVQRDCAEAGITSRRGARFKGSAEIPQQVGESPCRRTGVRMNDQRHFGIRT
jgi:hypothetical protein